MQQPAAAQVPMSGPGSGAAQQPRAAQVPTSAPESDAAQTASAPGPGAAQPPSAAQPPTSATEAASRAFSFRSAGAPELLAAALSAPVAGVGRRVRNDAAQPLVLDFAGGTRLTLQPQTELWMLDLAPSVLLVSGRVQLQRLPDAARPDQAVLRVATLAGAVNVTSAAELWLRVEPQRTAAAQRPRALMQLVLLQGGVSWQHVGADERLALEQLVHGAALPQLPELQLLAAKTLAEADKRAPSAFRRSRAWGPGLDPDARLEALLRELSSLREQGNALLSSVNLRLRRAQTPDAGGPRAYQREIVQHAQRKLALKQLALLAAEQSLLARLLACATAPGGSVPCAALAAWSERFAERVRSAL